MSTLTPTKEQAVATEVPVDTPVEWRFAWPEGIYAAIEQYAHSKHSRPVDAIADLIQEGVKHRSLSDPPPLQARLNEVESRVNFTVVLRHEFGERLCRYASELDTTPSALARGLVAAGLRRRGIDVDSATGRRTSAA